MQFLDSRTSIDEAIIKVPQVLLYSSPLIPLCLGLTFYKLVYLHRMQKKAKLVPVPSPYSGEFRLNILAWKT